ncbi:hypothetical protein KCU73_g9461, partial [Aureobasidium melanogenum]
MVRLFGHGILPLMGNTTWRETFSQYAAATAEPLLTELLAQCPTLRQICNRADKNFYQYVRIRAKIVDPPEDCLNGCSLNEDNVDLDAIAARVAIDLELQPTTGKRGTYLLLGRPRSLTQTTIALPATTIAGVRRSSRARNPEHKWALYGGKFARWKGIVNRASHLNLEPITAVFWVADGDEPMEVFTLMETFVTNRFGLYASKAGLKADLASLPSYGIFKCHQGLVPSNEKLIINSVSGALTGKATALAILRDYDYQRSRRGHDGPRPQELEDRYQQRTQMPVSNDDVCPIEGCDFLLLPLKRCFHYASNQWICQTCYWRAQENDNELRPVVRPRAARTEEAKAAAEEEDDTCGTSWCTNKMRDSTGKLLRHWRVKLQTHICDVCRKRFSDNELLETRPMENKCYGVCGKTEVSLTWDPKTRRWLCQSCIFGVPPKPDPLVCQTNWCLRVSDIVKYFRKDSQTWACSGCVLYDLADIADIRPPRSKCYDCGLDRVAKGKSKVFFDED